MLFACPGLLERSLLLSMALRRVSRRLQHHGRVVVLQWIAPGALLRVLLQWIGVSLLRDDDLAMLIPTTFSARAPLLGAMALFGGACAATLLGEAATTSIGMLRLTLVATLAILLAASSMASP